MGTSVFINAICGLKDAYGLSTHSGGYKYIGKGQVNGYAHDPNCASVVEGFANGSKIGIEYLVEESKLKFFRNDEAQEKFTMQLPTDVQGITHWYPAVSLRDSGDVCQIHNVRVTQL